MRFLSTQRRHPLTKVATLFLALFIVGALYTITVPTAQVAADGGNSAQVERGRGLYVQHCSSCHGLDAAGTSQVKGILDAGAAGVDFQMSTGRMPASGVTFQEPRRDTQFDREEIDAIAAYVQSLGDGVAIPTADQYDTEGLSDEELALGGELFRANCAQCHNFSGAGGAMPHGQFAPPLTEVKAQHIYEAVRTGPRAMPQFAGQAMPDEDLRLIIGYVTELRDKPARGGLTLGGLGPVSEGLWAWILGIGGLSLFAVWIAAQGARNR